MCIFFDAHKEYDSHCAKQLAHDMAVKAISVGGTCTGEHGVGLGKKKLLALEAGAGALSLMRLIKRSIDPNNILNPGKVVDVLPVQIDSATLPQSATTNTKMPLNTQKE